MNFQVFCECRGSTFSDRLCESVSELAGVESAKFWLGHNDIMTYQEEDARGIHIYIYICIHIIYKLTWKFWFSSTKCECRAEPVDWMVPANIWNSERTILCCSVIQSETLMCVCVSVCVSGGGAGGAYMCLHACVSRQTHTTHTVQHFVIRHTDFFLKVHIAQKCNMNELSQWHWQTVKLHVS